MLARKSIIVESPPISPTPISMETNQLKRLFLKNLLKYDPRPMANIYIPIVIEYCSTLSPFKNELNALIINS